MAMELPTTVLRRLAPLVLVATAATSCSAPAASPTSPATPAVPAADSGAAPAACPAAGTDFPVTKVTVGTLTFDVRMAGPEGGEAVLLLHGFRARGRPGSRRAPGLRPTRR